MNPTDFLKRLMHETKNAVLLFSLLFALLVFPAQATTLVYPGVIWSQTILSTSNSNLGVPNYTYNTNYDTIVGAAGTNSVGQVTNNALKGVVLAASTNFFNLSVSTGSQANTNMWPAAAFTLLSTYPNTYAPPSANVGFWTGGVNLMQTNNVASAVVYRFALNPDGTGQLWISNFYALSTSVAVNVSNLPPTFANTNFGAAAILALQQVENPTTNAWTNVLLGASTKADF